MTTPHDKANIGKRVCAKCRAPVDPLGCSACPSCGHDTYTVEYAAPVAVRERIFHPKDIPAIAAMVIGITALVFIASLLFGCATQDITINARDWIAPNSVGVNSTQGGHANE